jgi:hypothetical protein
MKFVPTETNFQHSNTEMDQSDHQNFQGKTQNYASIETQTIDYNPTERQTQNPKDSIEQSAQNAKLLYNRKHNHKNFHGKTQTYARSKNLTKDFSTMEENFQDSQLQEMLIEDNINSSDQDFNSSDEINNPWQDHTFKENSQKFNEECQNEIEQYSILSNKPIYPYNKQAQRKQISVIQLRTPTPLEEHVQRTNNAFKGNSMINQNYTENFPDTFHRLENTNSYKEESHLGTTYLGHSHIINQNDKFQSNLSFKITQNSTTVGFINKKFKTNILLDTGASKSYMSTNFYNKHKELHNLKKFSCTGKHIKVGNGELIKVKFAIPVILDIEQHSFEIFTLVADIEVTDIVWGMKNMYETEGILNTRDNKYEFINRAVPVFITQDTYVEPGKVKAFTITAPFIEELNGKAIIKMFSKNKDQMHTISINLNKNSSRLEIKNTTDKPLRILKKNAIGIVDIRSLGYYHINMNKLEANLDKDYQFNNLFHIIDNVNSLVTEVKSKYQANKDDPFPWLEKSDWRRYKTDKEILDNTINLKDSRLSCKERKKVMQIIYNHKKAFSLRDEIGECPNITVDIEVLDKSPFFVRPFNIAEEDKKTMDWQMDRLVHLGVLTKQSTSHSSPVMLISRKLTSDKRAVVDFRLLNSRIVRRNTTTPLMRDIFNTLGRAKLDILSCIDLKDAYHSIKLSKEAKELCGIVPYFGAPCYRFERMPQGLSISPAKWIEYVNLLLDDLSHRSHYIAIMDDLLAFSMKTDHFTLIENLFKAIEKHGLKISPKKCQLFMDEIIYMGNVFRVQNGKVTIRPMKSRIESIQKCTAPTNVRGCRRFCGMVNYLSMFCPNIQGILKPIHGLTKKGKPFLWTDEHEKAFQEIKTHLVNYPILHLPNNTGRFMLYTDTSRTHAGSALWQMQECKPKLIGYSSKTLPAACQNYSVTELEMKGLVTGIMTWRYVIGNKEFDCSVDHQAVVQISKAKTEPATKRIMILLEELAKYNFNLYYMKGKDMILSDYLSRADIIDGENPYELIPISIENKTFHEKFSMEKFNFQEILDNKYDMPTFNVMGTRSRAKKEGIIVEEVHNRHKTLNPHIKPEWQKPVRNSTNEHNHPIVQRTINHKQPSRTFQTSQKLIDRSRKILTKLIQKKSSDQQSNSDYDQSHQQETNQLPSNYPTTQRNNFPQHTINHVTAHTNYQQDPLIDLNGPLTNQEVEIAYTTPNKSQFEFIPPMDEQIDTTKIFSKHLPKQTDIDKILKQIDKKILRQTHLSVSLKDIQGAYLQSPHFKDIYVYLKQNKLPTSKRKASQIIISAQFYIVLDQLLFKILPNREVDSTPKLCIPTSKVDMILNWYHSSTLGAHMGMTKCILTIQERFYIPDLARHVRAYITGCHTCQLFKQNKINRPFQQRVNLNIPPLTKFSMDIKHMPPTKSKYKFILVLLCEVSNYVILAPLRSTTAEEVCEALIQNLFCYFGTPTHIICDQDPAFLANLMQYMMKQYDIKMLTIGPTNHKSLLAEHGIKSIANIIMKHLTGVGSNWDRFLPFTMLSYNIFCTPNLGNHAPSEIVLGRKIKVIPELEINPDIKVSATHTEYLTDLKKRLSYLRNNLQSFRDKRIQNTNKDKTLHSFYEGQLVYMYNPAGAILQTGSRKIRCTFVGPLVIYKAISPTNFILMSLDGMIYPQIVEETRIKPGFINTVKGTVHTLAQLRNVLRSGIKLAETNSI